MTSSTGSSQTLAIQARSMTEAELSLPHKNPRGHHMVPPKRI